MVDMQANSSVEAVVCLRSLKLLRDLPRFMAEAHRVLKPGSPFIFLQPGRRYTTRGICHVIILACSDAEHRSAEKAADLDCSLSHYLTVDGWRLERDKCTSLQECYKRQALAHNVCV